MKRSCPKWLKERFFNFRPFLFSALFLLVGVIFSYCSIVYSLSPWWVLLFFPFLLFKLLFSKNYKKTITVFLLLFLCFAVGRAGLSLSVSSFERLLDYDGNYSFSGRVTDIFEYERGGKRLTVDNLIIEGKEVKGKLTVYLGEDTDVLLGNELFAKGLVSTDKSLFSDERFRAEDIFEKRVYTANDLEEVRVEEGDFNLFLYLRNRIKTVLYAGMDKSNASVMLSVLTGDTTGMDWSLLSNVRYGGVAHLFAVSGLHVGAVFAFCSYIFSRENMYKIPKIVRFLSVAALLLFYGGICGFSPSVVRAIVTCLCFYADNLDGAKKDSLETVGKAAVVTILLQPVLLFSAGFQLSFAACLGISLLHFSLYKGLTVVTLSVTKGVRRLFKRENEWDALPPLQRVDYSMRGVPTPIIERVRRTIVDFFAVSIAAQIGTLPVQILTFGYVSGAGLLLNCLFVPMMSVSFSFMLILTAVACIFPTGWAYYILFAPKAVWSLALLIFYAFDFSTFALSFALSTSAVCSYIVFFVLWTDKLNLPKRLKRIFLCVFAFLLLLSLIIANTL